MIDKPLKQGLIRRRLDELRKLFAELTPLPLLREINRRGFQELAEFATLQTERGGVGDPVSDEEMELVAGHASNLICGSRIYCRLPAALNHAIRV